MAVRARRRNRGLRPDYEETDEGVFVRLSEEDDWFGPFEDVDEAREYLVDAFGIDPSTGDPVPNPALTLSDPRIDERATASLRRAPLRARSRGDREGAVISAGYHARKHQKPMYVYLGTSYMWSVWRATHKKSDATDPINNQGSIVYVVDPDLTVTVWDVVRPCSARENTALRNRLKRV